jgi:hypothetical protein
MAAKVGALTAKDELVWSPVVSDMEEVLWGMDPLVQVDVGGAEAVEGDFPTEVVVAVCDELDEGDPPRDTVFELDERPAEAVRVIKVVASRCWSETQPTLPTSCRLVEPRSPAPPVRST